MRQKEITFFMVASIFLVSTSVAQTSKPDTIRAYFIQEQPIQLDGVLDEPAWQEAMHISNFTQRELNVGEPATERTEVAILYTEKNLYIGVWAFDSQPNKIIAREMKRDFNHGLEDNFEVIIDTYNDDRNGFLFIINPNGARSDAQVLNNGESVNRFWDGVWNVKTRITAEGWFAEFVIPFSTLKFRTNVAEQHWGINFERNIRRKREQVLWQGWSRDADLEMVNRAGTLSGLENIQLKNFVEVKPYVIGGHETSTENKDALLNAGGDINYLVTPTLRLNLTFNTDFAQVEADQQQINLSRFPLFFPERREFFLEGQDYFNIDVGSQIIPFYSRRIGLTPERTTLPILMGTRLLGKVRNTTLGAMSIQTAQEGMSPSTNYTVLSWRQDVLEQSTVGILTTNSYADGRLHNTTGFYGRYSTSDFLDNKNLIIGATYLQNINSESFDKNANAHRVFLSYPNDKIEFDMAWNRSANSFEPEVGFLRRRNFDEFYAELEFKPRPKNTFRWIRQFSFKPLDINYFLYDNTGDLQSFYYEIRPLGFETRSGEFFEFNIQYRGEGLKEPFEIVEGIVIPKGKYWNPRYEVQARTFRSRPLSLGTEINWGNFFNGNSTETELELSWRTSRYLNISTFYERNWVTLPEGSFQTDLIGNRLEYALNPNLFGALFTQWNNEDQLALVNFRARWIPKIGSDFFLIINQIYDTSIENWRLERTTFLGKFIWRFVL